MNFKHRLILASKSPRRQQLLKDAGFDFSVKTIDIEEDFPSTLPVVDVGKYLAEKKANAFTNELMSDETVITADTVVIVKDKVLAKPEDKQEAFEMIRSLSGTHHDVITGVCLMSKSKVVLFDDVTRVYFKELSDEEINFYIDTFEPYDKAGAYGIQEWIGMIGIKKIEGSYFNVVGLPVQKVYEKLLLF